MMHVCRISRSDEDLFIGFCFNHNIALTVVDIGWIGNHVDTISYIIDIDSNVTTMLKLSICATIVKLERHNKIHYVK